MQSRTTPDPGHYIGKRQKKQKKHRTQEKQEVSPLPAGDDKAAMNRQESMTDNKKETQKKHHLNTVSKNILLEDLN